jgi:MFS family permease
MGIVLLLVAIVFISHFNRVSIATAGDARIMEQYGITPTRMGMVYSSFLLAYTLCMIPGGLFIDRFGARVALIVVGFGSALFVALTGVVGQAVRDPGSAFLALLLVRGLMGVVSSPLHPACARAVGTWVPAGGRSWTNGMINSAALVGIAATPLGFGGLITRFDWPVAFLISAGLTMGLALVWTTYATDGPGPRAVPEPPPTVTAARSDWLALLRDRSLMLASLSYGTVGYFQYLFFYWMNYYFRRVLLLPEETSASYAAILPLAMAVGMPLGGWLSDRLERVYGAQRSRKLVPMWGMAAGAALMALGVLSRDPVWTVAWFALALGAVGTAEGPFWATATELGGRRAGSAAALMNTGGNAGGMLAPVVTPWVGQQFGWGYAMGLGGLICLVGVVLWFGIDPRARPGEMARS